MTRPRIFDTATLILALIVLIVLLAIHDYKQEMWEVASTVYYPAAILLPYLYGTLIGRFRFWRKVACTSVSRGEYTILDVGCSMGAVMLEMAQANDQATVVGVDKFSLWHNIPNSPHRLYLNTLALGLSTDRLIAHRLANYSTLPFKDGTFNLVTSFKGVSAARGDKRHRLLVLQECIRVLKVGGRLVVVEDSFLLIRTYAKCLKELGWVEVDCFTVWNCWTGVIPARGLEAIKPGKHPSLDTV